jgi:hypothetical protein
MRIESVSHKPPVEPIKRIEADEQKAAEVKAQQEAKPEKAEKAPEPKRDPERILSERA